MPEYRFECEDCGIYWLKEGHMSDPPQTDLCPDCGEERTRAFVPTALQFKGTGFQTNISKVEKFHRDGWGKDDALEFYNTAIRDSKQRMKEGTLAYSRMSINPEYALKKGTIKKVDDATARQKAEAAKILTRKFNKQDKK